MKNKLIRKNNLAFTLAEVLIVIGIIGVIASIVIPSIITKQQQVQYISAWKKTYSVINGAQTTIANENGGDLKSAFVGVTANNAPSSNIILNVWLPYLKYTKKCSAGNTVNHGCYSGTMQGLSDDSPISDYPSSGIVSSIVLNDGIVLFFYPGVCTGGICNDTHIFVDVNGSKLPNRAGKDIFDLHYDANKKLFVPPHYVNSGCSSQGWNCSEYYLFH